MSFPSLSKTVTDTFCMRGEQFISWADMLHFSLEAQAVLTPFRERVLSYIYRTGRGLSEGQLEAAIVEPISDPDEEDSLHLHLALTIKMDWDEADTLHDLILARVSEWSQDWTEAERMDYGRWIYFSLTPSHI